MRGVCVCKVTWVVVLAAASFHALKASINALKASINALIRSLNHLSCANNNTNTSSAFSRCCQKNKQGV